MYDTPGPEKSFKLGIDVPSFVLKSKLDTLESYVTADVSIFHQKYFSKKVMQITYHSI